MQKTKNDFIGLSDMQSLYIGFVVEQGKPKFLNFKNEECTNMLDAYVYSFAELEEFVKTDPNINEDEIQEDIHVLNNCDNQTNFEFKRNTIYFISLYLSINSKFQNIFMKN